MTLTTEPKPNEYSEPGELVDSTQSVASLPFLKRPWAFQIIAGGVMFVVILGQTLLDANKKNNDEANAPVPAAQISDTGLSASDRELRGYGAFDACTTYVKDQLRAPLTAKFRNEYENDGEVAIKSADNITWTVVSSVDSENGFGALIRNTFLCQATFLGGDQWREVYVSLSAQ
jgi:hypothetical protein